MDSLRYILLNSQWVGDMLGALRYARARGGAHVFAWGQDLGSAVALAAANRERASCDAVAVEGLFRTTQEALLANGTSVLHELEIRHRRLVEGRDEPISAASRLRARFVVVAGRDKVTPPAATRTVEGRVPGHAEVWSCPTAGHEGAEGNRAAGAAGEMVRRWTVLRRGTWAPGTLKAPDRRGGATKGRGHAAPPLHGFSATGYLAGNSARNASSSPSTRGRPVSPSGPSVISSAEAV